MARAIVVLAVLAAIVLRRRYLGDLPASRLQLAWGIVDTVLWLPLAVALHTWPC